MRHITVSLGDFLIFLLKHVYRLFINSHIAYFDAYSIIFLSLHTNLFQFSLFYFQNPLHSIPTPKFLLPRICLLFYPFLRFYLTGELFIYYTRHSVYRKYLVYMTNQPSIIGSTEMLLGREGFLQMAINIQRNTSSTFTCFLYNIQQKKWIEDILRARNSCYGKGTYDLLGNADLPCFHVFSSLGIIKYYCSRVQQNLICNIICYTVVSTCRSHSLLSNHSFFQ